MVEISDKQAEAMQERVKGAQHKVERGLRLYRCAIALVAVDPDGRNVPLSVVIPEGWTVETKIIPLELTG